MVIEAGLAKRFDSGKLWKVCYGCRAKRRIESFTVTNTWTSDFCLECSRTADLELEDRLRIVAGKLSAVDVSTSTAGVMRMIDAAAREAGGEEEVSRVLGEAIRGTTIREYRIPARTHIALMKAVINMCVVADAAILRELPAETNESTMRNFHEEVALLEAVSDAAIKHHCRRLFQEGRITLDDVDPPGEPG